MSYTELAVFIKHVQQWQSVNAEYLSLKEKLDKKKTQYSQEMDTVSKLISKYSDDEVHDSAQVGALYKSLKRQEEQRKKNEEEIEDRKMLLKRSKFIDRKQKDLGRSMKSLRFQRGKKTGFVSC